MMKVFTIKNAKLNDNKKKNLKKNILSFTVVKKVLSWNNEIIELRLIVMFIYIHELLVNFVL